MSETLSVCLSCTSEEDTYDIFATHECEGSEEVYADMLLSCFNLKIGKEDGLNAMCNKCIFKLRDAFYFKQALLKNINDLQSRNDTVFSIEDGETLAEYLMLHQMDPDSGQMEYSLIKTEQDSGSEKEKFKIEANDDAAKIRTYARNKDMNTNCEKMQKNEKKVNPNKLKPFTLQPGQTTCTLCSQTHTSTKALHDHMNIHYPRFECPQCDSKFASETQLKRHRECHLEGPFACGHCDQLFANVNTRNSHVWRVHKSISPFVCSDCGQRFRTFLQRLRHKKEAHGMTEPKYPCPYCDNKYFYSGSRSKHIRITHLRERNFQCSECPMAFSKRRILLSHEATKHGIGEKNYVCTTCHKSFYRNTTLKHHMKTHLKAESNSHICDICGVIVAYKSLLTAHLARHETVTEAE